MGNVNSTCLEKRIAKNAARFCSSVQIGYALIEVGFADDLRFKRGFSDTFDHCGKSLPCKSFDQIGLAGVDVDHSR
jgi:hypothetical protein